MGAPLLAAALVSVGVLWAVELRARITRKAIALELDHAGPGLAHSTMVQVSVERGGGAVCRHARHAGRAER